MTDQAALRIDKWLWAARFYKTRALAAKAVQGGHVHVGGQRVKAARALRVGERVRIHRDSLVWEIEVREISAQRGPASLAQRLYAETDDSRTRREALIAQRRLDRQAAPRPPVERPDKRSRRRLLEVKRSRD
ncbi:MAG: RNA-binding S4 domain-containing protein [Pseudomonadota bacterium]|nr:RNA-binding S4 domain-containing protein [Pseudomonadota bacterium]HJO34713.1 RNA-binding S4 domain-containing protein [Gammaproteobacteria bacterium]